MNNGNDDAAGNRQEDAAVRGAGAQAIADAFVRARREGAALARFPGVIPDDLVTAYRVQDLAIAQWPDEVIGWKVGYIQPQRRDVSGDERLLGPIFRRQLWPAAGVVEFPVFVGGFAAVEAEYVLCLQADAPPGKTDWSPNEAAALPASAAVPSSSRARRAASALLLTGMRSMPGICSSSHCRHCASDCGCEQMRSIFSSPFILPIKCW